MSIVRTLLAATLGAALLTAAPVAQSSTGVVSDPEVVEPTIEQPTVDLTQPDASETVTADRPFAMIAATWDPGETAAAIEVRTRSGDQWSEWVELEMAETAVDPGSAEAAASRPATEPLWVDTADAVEVRTTEGPASTPRLELIDPGVAPQDDDIAEAPATGAASALPAQPRIVTRQEWGADESLRNCTPSIAATLKAAVVHHTVGSNNYAPQDSAAIVRGILAFHTKSRGWCDIGYNYLVDKYGTIFEGRYGGVDQNVIGAQVGGFNTYTLGVSMMGDHSSVAPTPATIESISRLLAWRLGSVDIDPRGTVQLTSAGNSKFPAGSVTTVSTINGHRDLYATECPGNVGYGVLPAVRTRVAQLIGASSPPVGAEPRLVDARPGPSVTSSGNGRLDVLTRAADGSIRHQARSNYTAEWSSWRSLGGQTPDTPAISSWPGRLDAFVRGLDGALWHRSFVGSWTPWTSLGGVLTSAPAAVSWGPGRIDVVARGADGALWHLPYENGWFSWRTLGGQVSAGAGITSRAWGSLDIVARGTDSAVWRKSWNGGWSAWSSLGGAIVGQPGVAAASGDDIVTLAQGTDGAVWQRRLSPTAIAGGWSSLGGKVISGIAAARTNPGRIVVMAAGTDGRPWYRERSADGSWSGWRPLDSAAAFRQLGTWVDTLDYSALEPFATVTAMHAQGVRTLYLGTGRYNATKDLIDPARIGQWLDAAKTRGLDVVGWYVPDYADLPRDVRRTLAVADYVSPEGNRFDGIGVDIEYPLAPPEGPAVWNASVSSHLRLVRASSSVPLIAISLPPLLMDAWSDPTRWATFPWADIGRYADAVAPMSYWTSFTPARLCPTNNQYCAYSYTLNNIARSRALTGLPVHVIGGVGDADAPGQLEDYVRATVESRADGGSFYDYRVTDPGQWRVLQALNAL